jgi:hypothetical protein
MHARNRTWPLGSDPAERCRQRTLPVEGGDGSTLSLDFTTGVLDPRLTFTRLGNATFINSSGLVEIAGANMFRNSVLDGGGGLNTPPTSWNNAVLGATYTVANNEVKIETNAGGTARAYMFANYFGSSASGLRYTIQFVVTGRTGSAYRLDELVGLPSNPPVSGTEQWFVNGISRLNSSTAWGIGDTITYSAVTTGGSSFFPSIGCGIFNPLGSPTSVTITRPQMNLGSTASAYYANSSTSAGYHDVPRFDYDPSSIGTPRGLLIEASAINLLNYSEQFEQTSYWTSNLSGVTWPRATVVADSTTAPDGNNTADTFEEIASTTGTHRCRSNSVTKTANAVMTMSIFVKNKDRGFFGLRFSNSGETNGCHLGFELSGNGTVGTGVVFGSGYGTPTGTITPVGTSGWYRVTMTASTDSTTSFQTYLQLQDSINNQSYTSGATALGVYVWGAQLEAGSGASSYIPTGASQGNRAADNCVTAIGNLTGFNANQGTIYESWRDNTASDAISVPIPVQEWAFAFGTSGANGCGVFVSNAASGTFGLSGGISNTGDAGPAGTYVIQGVNKAAIAINVATTSLRLSANGSAVSAGTNIAGYNGAQTFALGQRNNNTRYLNGWISQFKYWPYVLPDAQLTTLTTL